MAMFDRKKEEEIENGAGEASNEKTVIGISSSVKGDFTSNGDIVVFGKVSGKIKSAGMIAIGEEAQVEGDIESESIIIAGKVVGNINSETNIKLKSSAHIEGDVTCQALDIDNGAFFSGMSTMKGSNVTSNE